MTDLRDHPAIDPEAQEMTNSPARRIQHAEIFLPLMPGGRKLILDGVDITASVYGLDIHVEYDEITTLRLDLQVERITVDGEPVIEVNADVRAALEAAGWTPPQDLKIGQVQP